MKKKLLALLILLLLIPGLSSLFLPAAKADMIAIANQISIYQSPTKTTYTKGESLNFSDMVVEAYYIDGTSSIITDYSIEGYDCTKVGPQSIIIYYQNCITAVEIIVLPAKVTNISTLNHSTDSLTLTWEDNEDSTTYEIYCIDDSSNKNSPVASTESNQVTLYYDSGTIHTYQICSVTNIDGLEYYSEFSNPYQTATNPDKVTELSVSKSYVSAISLDWDRVSGATGYYIYRSPVSETNFKYAGKVTANSFTNYGLSSGTAYKYKVRAYVLDSNYLGTCSSEVETSTNPAKVALKYKAGTKKVRLTWKKVTGVAYYDIYKKKGSSKYSLLTTIEAGSAYSCIADGLTMGDTYRFCVIARRKYNGGTYRSQAAITAALKVTKIKNTSTTAKYFTTATKFINSSSYSVISFFSNNVKYSKSIIIPGLIVTNVGGFPSTSMCPQGMTFAEDYLLLSAYDLKAEENSVIYVIDKSTKKLLTTLILPSKAHSGGIGYDGTNVWIAKGTKVASIPFSEIEADVQKGRTYSYVDYNAICSIGSAVSFISYYKDKLWIGSYNELLPTYMHSYQIEYKDTEPSLVKADTIFMPTRVQGVAFTSKGYLILSRSCQLYKGLRGYMHQLDVYHPNITNTGKVILLGERRNKVYMPSMNEEIDIDGYYLYVNFESGAFNNASYKMDRISAFKLSIITKKAS